MNQWQRITHDLMVTARLAARCFGDAELELRVVEWLKQEPGELASQPEAPPCGHCGDQHASDLACSRNKGRRGQPAAPKGSLFETAPGAQATTTPEAIREAFRRGREDARKVEAPKGQAVTPEQGNDIRRRMADSELAKVRAENVSLGSRLADYQAMADDLEPHDVLIHWRQDRADLAAANARADAAERAHTMGINAQVTELEARLETAEAERDQLAARVKRLEHDLESQTFVLQACAPEERKVLEAIRDFQDAEFMRMGDAHFFAHDEKETALVRAVYAMHVAEAELANRAAKAKREAT